MVTASVTVGAALAGLLGLLASLPKLITYVERVVASFEELAKAQHKLAQAQEAANALEYSKITKDTSKLENLFNPKPKP